MTRDNLNEFQRAYVECALWTEEMGHIEVEQVDDESIKEMIKDCNQFYQDNAADLIWARENALHGYSASQAGHDFWLTRNGHGTGFWDRGLGQVGQRLTTSAKGFKEVSLYLGDDGRIYAE